MHKDPFVQFIRYVECDQALDVSRDQAKVAASQLESLAQSIIQEEQRIEKLKTEAHIFSKKMHTYELESRINRDRQNEIKRKLDSVTSAKEYEAYHRELGELERSHAAHEEQTLQTWQAQETAQNTYNNERTIFETTWLPHQKQLLTNKEQDLAGIKERAIHLEQEKNLLEKLVNPEFLDDYLHIKKSLPNPVVPILGTFCSACRHELSQRDLSLARKHVLVTCKNCYRKLYISLDNKNE